MTVSLQSFCPHGVDGRCALRIPNADIFSTHPPCVEMEQQRDEGTEKGESQNTQSIQQSTRKSTKIKLMQMIRSSLWACVHVAATTRRGVRKFCYKLLTENELENKQVQYQEKCTEVDGRTAELYSKQGNIDITEFVVIDEITQCKVCEEYNAKGKSFCTGGTILQELSAEKTKR